MCVYVRGGGFKSQLSASFTYFGELLRCDFVDGGNYEVGIYFRDRRVYEIGLIPIRDVSPLFCACSLHGRSVQAPIRL